MPDFYRTSKFDLVIIALILLFSTSSILWFAHQRRQQSSQSAAALIYEKDKLVEEIDLNQDRIINLPNAKMQIEVKAGKVRVLKSDCPQRICVNMGWIEYSGQTIACVPNRVLIEIKSTGSPLIDAVSY